MIERESTQGTVACVNPEAHIRIDIAPASGAQVRLLAVGDFCMPTTEAEGCVCPADAATLYGPELREVLQRKDLSIANLECPIPSSLNPILKPGPCLAGTPGCIELLQAARFDVVGLANNHIMDHGPGGMFETRQRCEQGGMRTVGIGSSDIEAARPVVLTVNGLRVGILAFCEQEFSCAGPGRPGAARLEPTSMARAIEGVRGEVDILVVYAHGGKEYYPLPTPRIYDLYRFCVDCGADAVIGHHPHTVQGVEVYRGRPIIYSLGNFLFPHTSSVPPCWNTGFVCCLNAGGGGVYSVELFATEQDCQGGSPVVRMAGTEKVGRLRSRCDRMSEALQDPRSIRQAWICLCEDLRSTYYDVLKCRLNALRASPLSMLRSAVGYRNAQHAVMAVSEMLGRLFRGGARQEHDRVVVCNLLRCPTHHEVLTQLLEASVWPEPVADGVRSLYAELMADCR